MEKIWGQNWLLELVMVFQIAWEMVSLEIYCMCLGEYILIEHISSTKDATSGWIIFFGNYSCLFVCLGSSLITSFAWTEQILRSVQDPVGLSRLRSFISSLESSSPKRELFSPKCKRHLKQQLSLSVFRKELKHSCNSEACATPLFWSKSISTCAMLLCGFYVQAWI